MDVYRYKTSKYSNKIEKRKITRETGKTVWFISEWQGQESEHHALKYTNYERWFDTFQLAKDHLTTNKIEKLKHLASQHVIESNELALIEALTEEK